jgi:hypothetical protein
MGALTIITRAFCGLCQMLVASALLALYPPNISEQSIALTDDIADAPAS